MAGGSIRLEGDTRAMLKKIRRFADIDKKKINSALRQVVRSSTLKRFKESRAPDGEKWEVSKRAAAETKGKTLIRTADLRNSIRSKSDVSGFAVGTDLKYAATHQFGEKGRTIRAKNKKALRFQVGGKWLMRKSVTISIPARPYLGLSDDDMQEIKGTIEDFIGKDS